MILLVLRPSFKKPRNQYNASKLVFLVNIRHTSIINFPIKLFQVIIMLS